MQALIDEYLFVHCYCIMLASMSDVININMIKAYSSKRDHIFYACALCVCACV